MPQQWLTPDESSQKLMTQGCRPRRYQKGAAAFGRRPFLALIIVSRLSPDCFLTIWRQSFGQCDPPGGFFLTIMHTELVLRKSGELRYSGKWPEIGRRLILDNSGWSPGKGPEDCFQIVFRDFGRTLERLSKRTLQEGQLVQKIVSRLSKNNLETFFGPHDL